MPARDHSPVSRCYRIPSDPSERLGRLRSPPALAAFVSTRWSSGKPETVIPVWLGRFCLSGRR
jgi:hypothetical protein